MTSPSDLTGQNSNNQADNQSNQENDRLENDNGKHHKKITRRAFLAYLGTVTLGLAAVGKGVMEWRKEEEIKDVTCLSASTAGKLSRDLPNIIFILADDLGYGDLGSYGQTEIQTPNLDALAAEGMRFSQCYAGSPLCAPSRCTLLTGLHTGHARIRGNNAETVPLHPEDYTVTELLKCAGYTTGMFGKWGLSRPDGPGGPGEKGFDEWFGYLRHKAAHNYYPDHLWRNGERVEIAANQNGQKGSYSPDLFTEEALAFISTHKDKPFFLYLPYTPPHANVALGEETGNGLEVPVDAPYSDKPWPQQEKDFAAMVTRLDGYIGQLVAHLKKEGLDENTIIFFTSDNGPHEAGGHDAQFFQSAGPLRGQKFDLYEGGIRVPMIVRWPGKIAPGSVSRQPLSFCDFLPTAADIAGLELPAAKIGETALPHRLDGLSVLPILLGQSTTLDREFLYWEVIGRRNFKQAVRLGDWKGVRHQLEEAIELYNLSEDLGEQHDLAGLHPDIVTQIAGIMQTAHVPSPDFLTPDQKWTFWPLN